MAPGQVRVITTRLRAGVAVALTAFLLVVAIRGAFTRGNVPEAWLIKPDVLLHGWPLVALNVALYGYLWWLAHWFVRGTYGRERLLVAASFVGVLLWPLKAFQNGWLMEMRCTGIFGYAVALIAAVSLL